MQHYSRDTEACLAVLRYGNCWSGSEGCADDKRGQTMTLPPPGRMLRRRPLDISEILRWADACQAATGRWPTNKSGAVAGAIGETWSGIDASLQQGTRGLPGGSSLARLLAERRSVRNRK